jgi:hypothetical protein
MALTGGFHMHAGIVQSHFRWIALAVGGSLALLHAGTLAGRKAAAEGEDHLPTPVDEVVMYGVDDDTDELLRYVFDSEEYLVIGVLEDADGNRIDEVESLGYIPRGPHRGLYGVTNYDGDVRTRLIKINPLDASVTVYPVDTGFGNVEGMVAARDPDTDRWILYAVQTGSTPWGDNHGNGNGHGNGHGHVTLCHVPPGNPGNAHTITVGEPAVPAHLAHGDQLDPCDDQEAPRGNKNLIVIDPATGVAEMVMALGKKFEGLARGPDGVLYAAKQQGLWAIDLYMGTKTEVGGHDYAHVEALEFAFGDYDPHIEVPGVPEEWTANGVLFGASDQVDSILILDPATGAAVEYDLPFPTPDWEGIIFLTKRTDPYGVIVAEGYD